MYIKSSEYLSKFTGKQIDDAISNIRDYDAELALKADKSTTINGFPISEDIIITAQDIGALPNTIQYGASIDYESGYLYLIDQDGSVISSEFIELTVPDGNRALISDNDGKVVASNISSQELDALSGVTSNIQAQLDEKSGDRYGSCETSSSIATKEVTLSLGSLSNLEAGVKVAVSFRNANSAQYPTLNVNNTGSKAIFCSGTRITDGETLELLRGTVEFVYDGTQWNLIGGSPTGTTVTFVNW